MPGMRRPAALVVLVALALPGGARAAWSEPVAGPLNVSAAQSASSPSIALVESVPHVAWAETDPDVQNIRVKRLNAAGTAWEEVVGPVTTNTSLQASSPSLGAVGSVPYVAWDNEGLHHGIHVKRLNSAGDAWEELGGELNVVGEDAGSPTLSVVGSIPYVAWTESASAGGVNQIRVKRLKATGDGWEEPVAGALNVDVTHAAVHPSVAALGATPYVAWTEETTTGVGQIRVKRLNLAGDAWEEPAGGGSLNIDAARQASAPSIASVGGVAYLAWREANAGGVGQLRVKRLNAAGTAWEEVVPGPLNVASTSGVTFRPGLAGVAGVPHVVWSEPGGAAGADQIHVKRLSPSGTAWVEPEAAILNVDPARDGGVRQLPSLVDDAGAPLVAWDEPNASAVAQIRVKRFTPTPPDGLGAIPILAPAPSGLPALAAASRLGLSRRAFPAAAGGASIAARRRRRTGTTVSYRLTTDSRVRFRVERRVSGRRVGGKCVRQRRSNRGRRRCARFVTLRGTFHHAGRAARNSFRFTGRLRGRKLRPGRYRLLATPLAADGRRGRSVRTAFRIVR